VVKKWKVLQTEDGVNAGMCVGYLNECRHMRVGVCRLHRAEKVRPSSSDHIRALKGGK